MSDNSSPDFIGPVLGAIATALTALLGYLGLRFSSKKNPQVDPQDALNDGFQGLLEQMRKELQAASRERNHLNKVLEEERRTWRAEREAWRAEREALTGEIAQLQAVAAGFERVLRRAGVDLPPRHAVNDLSAMQSVEATLRQEGMDGDA